jgi:hypothetical protein
LIADQQLADARLKTGDAFVLAHRRRHPVDRTREQRALR